MRLAVVVALVAGTVVASTAGAATRLGTARADTVRGTVRADFIDPRTGRDRVAAGRGDDRIKAQDQFVDTIGCGPGWDLVTADLRDRLDRSCEVAVRQLSRDPYGNPESQHATEVEPDSYAFGSTISSVFQVGRARDGGAANIGFSTSTDAGRTWRSGLLPSLTANSTPRGDWERASDPVVGYDALHGVWLASSLAITRGQESALVFNRSTDGVRWSAPVIATSALSRTETLLDKQWFACDNWPSSPFRGHCYLSYSDFRSDRISVQVSTDGGATWSPPVAAPDNAGREALRTGRPASNPSCGRTATCSSSIGTTTRCRRSARLMAERRSRGRSSSPAHRRRGGLNFRAFALPVAEVDAAGTVYLVWSDCQLRPSCSGTDLLLARSADGVQWTGPTRIGTGRAGANVHDVVPGLGADPRRPGRVAVAWYRLQPNGGIDAYYVRSATGGTRWSAVRRLNTETMTRSWIAQTSLGPMLGDYISTSFANGTPVAVLALASRPGRRLDEAIYAARLR